MADVIGAAEFELRATKDKLKADVESAERDLKQSTQRIERDYSRLTAAQVREMGGLEGVAKRLAEQHRATGRAAADGAQMAEREFRKSADGIGRAVRQMAGVLAAAFSVREITRMADGYTQLQNRLRVAGLEGAALLAVQDRLFESATRNGVEIRALGELYGRLALSTGELGVSQAEILRLTDGVTAALRVQGTSTQAASGALMQLAQALGAGTVRAEEINSILEQTPIIAQAAASGMGISVAALRTSVAAGEVSSRQFFDALMAGFPAIEEQAESAALTIGQALTGLGNELLRYVGLTDDAMGASERMANAIKALADNISTIIPIVAALSVGFGVSYVGGMIAAHRATLTLTAAMAGLRTAMTFISSHPLMIALTALAAGVTYLALTMNDAAVQARALERAVESYAPDQERMRQLTNDLTTASREHAEALRAERREILATRFAELAAAQGRLDAARADARFIPRPMVDTVTGRPIPRPTDENGRPTFGHSPDVRRRQAEVDALRQSYEELIRIGQVAGESAIAPVTPPSGSGGAGSRAAGPSPEDIARSQEALQLQLALDDARARGDTAAIARIEDRVAVIRLIEELERAQLATGAEAVVLAETHVGRLREMADAEIRLATLSAEKAKAENEAADARERAADLAQDQLDLEIQLARLSGDEARFRALSREEEIRRRIVRLMEQVAGLSEAEARKQATAAVESMDRAEREGDLRDQFRRSFAQGIRAAIDGDVGSFFERLADRFTDRMLENLADDLFDLFLNASRGLQGGGGGLSSWISAAASIFGAQVTSPALGAPKVGGLPGSAMAAPSAGASMMKALIRVESNDDKFRLFIQETAGPMVVEGGLRAAQGGARMAAESANRTRYYLKGAN